MSDPDATVGAAPIDEGLARRLKALACTAPLHDLDARKTRVDWADAADYQMAEIALQAIDQVTIAMDFDRGASHEQVVARLRPFIRAQCPDRSDAEHDQVARWVLDNLLNVGSMDRGFHAVYGSVGAGGKYERRGFDFKLLVELAAPDGEVFLRATDEAINVLVGALDTDVESAQIAAEVKLDNLIKRGRLADARLAAEQARYRTVQFAETLRRKLEATRRDVRSVDWTTEVPALLDDALTHIENRFRAENAILRNIAAARDDTEESDRKRRAAELLDIVRDCIRRHTQLQARLQSAGETFRTEQDRQQFAGPPRRASVDLYGQLLTPTLSLPLAEAVRPTSAFFGAGAGLKTVSVPGLVGLVETLLLPAPERDGLGLEVTEPQLAPLPDPGRYSDAQWARAAALFERDSSPRRLSGLLADARAADPDLAGLVALRALHAFSPEIGTAVRQGESTVLVAVDDGTPLSDPEFGGADLLLSTARLDTTDRGDADLADGAA
jgi:hypothetical protein